MSDLPRGLAEVLKHEQVRAKVPLAPQHFLTIGADRDFGHEQIRTFNPAYGLELLCDGVEALHRKTVQAGSPASQAEPGATAGPGAASQRAS